MEKAHVYFVKNFLDEEHQYSAFFCGQANYKSLVDKYDIFEGVFAEFVEVDELKDKVKEFLITMLDTIEFKIKEFFDKEEKKSERR